MKKYIFITLVLLVSCQKKTPYNLGDKYYLEHDLNYYFAVYYDENIDDDNTGKYIDGDILKINYDSTFVIALIKPVYKITESEEGKKIHNYKDRKKLIETSLMREYWILNKKNEPKPMKNENGYFYSNVYGPFNEEEYLKKLKELGVSDSLQLIPVKQFLEKE